MACENSLKNIEGFNKADIFLQSTYNHKEHQYMNPSPANFGLLPILELNNSKNIISKASIEEDVNQAWREFIGYELADVWDEKLAEYQLTKFGDCSYLRSFDIMELGDEKAFAYKAGTSQYAEHLATMDLINSSPQLLNKYYEVYKRKGLGAVLRYAMPSTMKINVAVVNEWGNFLAVKRSGKVGYKRGIWTVGPNETLESFTSSSGEVKTENFSDAAERCLSEELGLEDGDYTPVKHTFLAYDLRTLQLKIYSNVKVKISADELKEKIMESESRWEADAFKWIPLEQEMLHHISSNGLHDSSGRQWSSSALISLSELLKYYI